jgi:CyaY protein
MSIDESRFNQLAEAAMNAIEEAIEASGADIDYDSISDILTLEFADGSRIIINKQAPARQLWVAAKSGGYHFDYDEAAQRWVLDSDPRRDLFTCLGDYCTEQAGEPIELKQEQNEE